MLFTPVGMARMRLMARALRQKRSFSGGGGMTDAERVKEINKWRLMGLAGLPLIAGLMFMNFSHEHAHAPWHPQYPYLRLRYKDFPWGQCDLLDFVCHKRMKAGKPGVMTQEEYETAFGHGHGHGSKH